MHFMNSFTLVNKMRKRIRFSTNHGLRKLILATMVAVIALTTTTNATANNSTADAGSSPSFTKGGNRLEFGLWVFACILALIAIIIGFTQSFDMGEAGGASQIFQWSIIGIGFAVAATSIVRMGLLGSAMFNTKSQDGVYDETQIEKFEEAKRCGKDITTWFGIVLLVVLFHFSFILWERMPMAKVELLERP